MRVPGPNITTRQTPTQLLFTDAVPRRDGTRVVSLGAATYPLFQTIMKLPSLSQRLPLPQEHQLSWSEVRFETGGRLKLALLHSSIRGVKKHSQGQMDLFAVYLNPALSASYAAFGFRYSQQERKTQW
jgi:hypothetical protein